MAYLRPEDIVTDFLRNNLTDPRVRISSTSDTFTATASQTTFTLSPSSGTTLSHVISVTSNAVTQVKWQDYYIDFKNEKIIFFTGISVGLEVIVSYGEGATNWIFPKKPNKKLSATSFPRMNIQIVSAPGLRQGNYQAAVEGTIRFQIDVWCKEKQDDQIFTIDGSKYTGEDLADYLGWKVTEAFEDNESELFPALYGYVPVGMPPNLPFDDEMQCHHTIVECLLKGLNIGRIS